MKDKNDTLFSQFNLGLFQAREYCKRQKAYYEDEKTKDVIKARQFNAAQKGVKLIQNGGYGFTGAKSRKDKEAEKQEKKFGKSNMKSVPSSSSSSSSSFERDSPYAPFAGFQPIAASTTAVGRKSIQLCIQRVELTQ